MKKLLRFFLLVVALLIGLQVPASAASIQDNLVPQDSETGTVGEVDLKYNEYPQHHYKLDTWVDTDGDWMPWNWADGAGKQIYIALMEIINSVWNINILLANFTMKIVQEAFELDFVSNVSDEIGSAIQNIAGFGPGGFMANGLWPLLVTFIIGIVGAWATYVGMVKRESSRAWGGLISSMIIFVFALGFFSNASSILKEVNEWSSDLQSDILAVSASVVNPGSSYTKEEGIATIRNQMFDLMIKKPYMLMQYGTTEIGEERVNDILSIDPFVDNEERQEEVKKEVQDQQNKMMSIDGISSRAGFVPLLFLANTIIGIFLLIVSGTIILYQMIFLALVLFAPVPLLMALVPRWKQSAFDWGMKVLHAQLMKISIALLLTILFGISAVLYRATEKGDLGYLGMMLLQIICFVGIWAKRKELFNIVSTAVSNIESSTGATLQGYKQKYRQAKKMVSNNRNRMEENNSRGRIRNQPLAQRNIGYLNSNQLADRKKGIQATKDGLVEAASSVMLADRSNQEFREGQEDYAKLKNRTGVENASTDREQLMDRKDETTMDNQNDNQNSNVTSIDDLRRRRLESGGLANAPLADRQSLQNGNREAAASLEQRPEMRDTEISDRTQSGRNINLQNQHSHEDRINEQQGNQLSERRAIDRSTDREVSQDTTNRERFVNNNNERNINDTVNRNVVNNEGREQNIQETVNRNQISNENNDRTVNNITERNNNVSENYRNVQENMTERESVSHNVTRRNEQNVNVNREQVNVSRIIENARENDKPITKWEAQQQINERNNRNK